MNAQQCRMIQFESVFSSLLNDGIRTITKGLELVMLLTFESLFTQIQPNMNTNLEWKRKHIVVMERIVLRL